ncbi:hypothetical protein SCA6_002031 [Theobroma cacao]
MNSTTDSGGFLGSNNIGGFGYGIGVSVGILLLITTITLASYFCTRTPPPQAPPRARQEPTLDPESLVVDLGLDEETIKSYPKLLYSEAKLHNKDSTSSCCSICLADYKSSDTLRLLPDCNHLFHLKCVDPWLRLHPTCPVCRTSPIPTPLSTPLAEALRGRNLSGWSFLNCHGESSPRARQEPTLDPESLVVDLGLDEETIKSYPKLLYSEAKLHDKDSTSSCCSICLADYKGSDTLRLLPDCNHLFHLKCVDPWLRLHPTCPVCRTSLIPTPLSTPLAEVVPLSSRPGG